MDIEPAPKQQSNVGSYSKTWNDFIDRAMPLLVDNPTQTRYTIKFLARRNIFVLKVTDGGKIVMKKCKGFE